MVAINLIRIAPRRPPGKCRAAQSRVGRDLPAAAREEAEQHEHEHDDQDDPENRHGGAPLEIVVAEQTDEGAERLRARGAQPFPLLECEADEKHPDREHRAEHAEDDPRCNQVRASESAHEQPEPTGEDQPGAELTEEEPSESVSRDAPP